EEFVPIVDGADVGIAGVGAAFAGGVGDHDFGFGADVGVGFGEGDGVAVGFRHFATVEAGDAGGGGEHHLRFRENVIPSEKLGCSSHFSSKILKTNFACTHLRGRF